ncbi:hypothetical protein C8R45DRAFT_1097827 [Mycena sanguinolenta]|nr:hypothetical protein C8R45DRAFT_1097827 [Mycena sanguinolenta]
MILDGGGLVVLLSSTNAMSSPQSASPSVVLLPCPLSLLRHRHRTEMQAIDDDLGLLQQHHDALLLSLCQQHEARVHALRTQRIQAQNSIRMNCNIDHIPDELLEETFRYLLGPQFPIQWTIREVRALNTLLLVCRRWAAVTRQDPSLWRCLRMFITEPEPDSDSVLPTLTRNAAFEPHLMLFNRLRLTGNQSVEVDVGAMSSAYHDPGLVPVLARHAWRLERLTIAVRASALWHLGAHMPRLRLLSISVLEASAASQPTWEPFHAARLQHVEIEDVCSIPTFLQSIPWSNLLSLVLIGTRSQLSPPALLHILMQTPWLVVCHAVLRQSVDLDREIHATPNAIPSYPVDLVTMRHLRELILEIIPWRIENWERAEEPFLDCLSLPVLCGLSVPILWFDSDAVGALRRLETRSGQLPQDICMTAVPPGEWFDWSEEFSIAFPNIAFGMSCSVLVNDALRVRWERRYELFRRGLDDDRHLRVVVLHEGCFDYDWDYDYDDEAHSDHGDYSLLT